MLNQEGANNTDVVSKNRLQKQTVYSTEIRNITEVSILDNYEA